MNGLLRPFYTVFNFLIYSDTSYTSDMFSFSLYEQGVIDQPGHSNPTKTLA